MPNKTRLDNPPPAPSRNDPLCHNLQPCRGVALQPACGSTLKFHILAMMLRAILAFLLLPAMFAGLFPWLLSGIPAPVLFRSLYGVAPLVLGGGILLSAVVSFYRRGRGTLAPWDPPKRLVVRDLYRFTRNPMYVGVVALVCGWALVTGNPWNYAYATVVPVIFHLRVVFYEEKQLERLFGREWNSYRKAVPRWGVALRPYTPGVAPAATANRRPSG